MPVCVPKSLWSSVKSSFWQANTRTAALSNPDRAGLGTAGHALYYGASGILCKILISWAVRGARL